MLRDDRDRPIRLRFRGVPIFARVSGLPGHRRHRFYEIGWISVELLIGAVVLGVLLWAARLTGLARPLPVAIAAPLIGTLLFVWAIVGFVSMAIAARATPQMCERVFESRISQNKCRACSFSLDGLSPQPDGCTVCPECGAAWRLRSADD